LSTSSSRRFGELERSWNQLASDDPLWAVMSDPDKKGNRWNVDEFLASGRLEVEHVMAYLEKIGLPPKRGRALDFGCGVGRLSQALGDHFSQVVGVDIAPNMVQQARRLNRHGDRVNYLVNSAADLAQLETGSFDFAYSSMVLQHMHPHLQERYIAELLRVVAVDGVLVFQVIHPARLLEPRAVLKSAIPLRLLEAYRRYRYGDEPRFELWSIPARKIRALVRPPAASIVDVWSPGAGKTYSSFRYCIRRA
jgi:SAM-dependent methyltransferase